LKKFQFKWTIIILLWCSFICEGQTDYVINPADLNAHYLSSLIINEQNVLRQRAGQSILVSHPLLRGLATERAKQQLLDYLNKITVKRKPIDQALKVRGVQFSDAIEISHTSYLEEPLNYFKPILQYTYRNQTYRQTAMNILEDLKSKNLDQSNINISRFTQTGVGIAVDTISNLLFVVHLLAVGLPDQTDIDIPNPPESETEFKSNISSSTVWIKPPKMNTRNLRMAQAWARGGTGFDGWVSTSRKKIRKAFRLHHFRSGLVLEENAAFHYEDEMKYLATPSRTNRMYVTNGELSKRIKRKEIMAMWKYQAIKKPLKIFGRQTPFKKWPDYASIKVPGNNQPGSTSKILVVRKGMLCDIIPVAPLPGKELMPIFPRLPFLLPPLNQRPDTLTIHREDSFSYKIYYSRGIASLNEEDQQGLLDLIPPGALVKKINVQAFASIEGTADGNEKLFIQRANTIKEFLEQSNVAVANVQIELDTKENWKLMIEQLKSDSTLNSISTKGELDIRDFVNDHLKDSLINNWMDDQRYAWVSFDLLHPEKKTETSVDVLNEFDSLLKSPKFSAAILNKLVRLQKRYYDFLVISEQTANNRLEVPKKPKDLSLDYQQAVFRYQHQHQSDSQFYSDVKKIINQKSVKSSLRKICVQHHQIYLANSIFEEGSIQVEFVDWNCPVEKSHIMFMAQPKKHRHQFSELPTLVEALDLIPRLVRLYRNHTAYQSISKQLDFYYCVNRAQLLLRENKFIFLPEVKRLSGEVWKNHVMKTLLTDDETTEFAQFFILTYQKQYAIKLLKPLVTRPQPNADALKIWISLQQGKQSERETENDLLDYRKHLTPEQWTELVESGTFLPLQILERYKVRHAWYDLSR
jgi:hypothetical protein